MRLFGVVVASLAFVSHAAVSHAAALSETERRILVEKIDAGEIVGGAYRIQVTPEAAPALSGRLKVERDRGRYFVNRDLDPAWQDCMTKAGGAWMFRRLLSAGETARPTASQFAGMAGALIDLTDLPTVQNCNSNWHSTLYQAAVDLRFNAIEANIKTKDELVRDYVRLLFETISADVVVLEKDGKKLKADVRDLKGGMAILSGQMRELQAQHKKLTELILEERKKNEALAEIARQRENVEASVMGVQLLSRVVLSKDPIAQSRLITGAKSIGTIADSIVQLKENGLATGKKLILSGNIANAALAIVGLFGPMGKDPTIELLESGFAAVRQDIRALKEAMDYRFDLVEKALDVIYSSMQVRFTELQKRVDLIAKRVDQLDERLRAHYALEIEGFRALLARDFQLKMAKCFNPEAPKILDYSEFADCLLVIAQYGAEDAKNDVFTGAIFADPTNHAPEMGAELTSSLDPDYHRGYLAATLRHKSGGLGEHGSSISLRVPSPMAWSGSVDAYLALRIAAPKFTKIRGADIQSLTRRSLEDLQKTGTTLLQAVGGLRKGGVALASEIYLRDASATSVPVAHGLLSQIADVDLGVTEEVDYRTCKAYFIGEPPHDSGMRLVRGTALAVKEGPDKGAILSQVRVRIRLTVSGLGARAEDVARNEEACKTAPRDDQNYPLNSYGPPVDTDPLEIQKARKAANEIYLRSVKVSAWPQKAKDVLLQAIKKPLGSPAVRESCAKLGLSKLYLMQLAMLYRGNVDLIRDEWANDLSNLPGNSDNNDMTCSELAGHLASGPLTFTADEPAAPFLEKWIAGVVQQRTKAFNESYRNALAIGDMPEIQVRLKRLEICLTGTALRC